MSAVIDANRSVGTRETIGIARGKSVRAPGTIDLDLGKNAGVLGRIGAAVAGFEAPAWAK